jgi:hypothetical protein
MARADAVMTKLKFRDLGPANSGGLPQGLRSAICCGAGRERVRIFRGDAVRGGPTDERFERNATGWQPLVRVVRARSVAVRPGALVDREASLAVP